MVDSGPSKDVIDDSWSRVEDMLKYTKIKPLVKIRAAVDNVLQGTAQGILQAVVRGRDDVLRTVKLLIVLVPGLKGNLFLSSAAAQKCGKTIIENNGLSLGLGPFSV